ncbi:glycosyltransferase family 2 protein [Candidatus Woesearchaeota archaeon]|nr:glycosyltransferase family 2 protein [Candidatus Woesearchaeota archaeon]
MVRGKPEAVYSVVLPCRNEELAIAACIEKARAAMESTGKPYQIIVSDSSSDRSAAIARRLGALVVTHAVGYGNALRAGFAAARGEWILMGDADGTYDFAEIPRLLARRDADLVLGSRFLGTICPGAMPALHRYVGNPLLSRMLNLLFGARLSDAHTGFRLIRRVALDRLDLRAPGMELASEMIIKAVKRGFRIAEVPITYHPRRGQSKLSSFRDGWRHLRFMLLFSPDALFVFPGIALFLIGIILLVLFSLGPVQVLGFVFDIHPIFIGSLLTVTGFVVLVLGVFSKIYARLYLSERSWLAGLIISRLSLERSLLLGILLFLIGLVIGLRIVIEWVASGFGALTALRPAILALTILILGVVSFFSAFFLSVLGIAEPSGKDYK